ncbi:STN domain-containing protein [Luteibacter sp. CQ10]|uniref:STN domain-containing protein n=1 Tax=Luteibacter sp. CQ10 TaxID=2805821 RepID=UPI0034A5A4F1
MARSVIAFVACVVLLGAATCRAQDGASTATPRGVEVTHAPTRFDIDAQPLAGALRAFSEATGIAVLFDDALVAPRETPGLHDTTEPRDALRILLIGTGLEARFSSMNAFTVTAVDTPDAAGGVPSSDDVRPELDERTATEVQRAIERALCAHRATRPGRYRLAMQLWTDGQGVVSDVSPLGVSDDPSRDGDVVAALRGKRLPGVTSRFSPVTVLIRPTSSTPCGDEG